MVTEHPKEEKKENVKDRNPKFQVLLRCILIAFMKRFSYLSEIHAWVVLGMKEMLIDWTLENVMPIYKKIQKEADLCAREGHGADSLENHHTAHAGQPGN